MMKLPADWNAFFASLIEHKVRFLVVGAYALAAHGHPRATADLDVLVEPTLANARRLGLALRDFGFDALAEQWREFARDDVMVSLGMEPYRIDVLTWISGVSFAQAWADRTRLKVGRQTVPVLGFASLLDNKRASGRLKDLADLELLTSALPPVAKPKPRKR